MMNKLKNFKTRKYVLVLTNSLALGSVMAVSSNISSAQAASFFTTTSVINFTGSAVITPSPSSTDPNPSSVSVTLGNGTVTNTSTGNFVPFIGATPVKVSDITLTNPTGSGAIFTYNGTAANNNPFIDFGSGLTFKLLSNPFQVVSSVINTGGIDLLAITLPKLTGTFFKTGSNSAVGTGTITFNQILNNGSYSATLVANPSCCTPVPEPTSTGPLTVLGLATLAFSQKLLLSKNREKLNKC